VITVANPRPSCLPPASPPLPRAGVGDLMAQDSSGQISVPPPTATEPELGAPQASQPLIRPASHQANVLKEASAKREFGEEAAAVNGQYLRELDAWVAAAEPSMALAYRNAKAEILDYLKNPENQGGRLHLGAAEVSTLPPLPSDLKEFQVVISKPITSLDKLPRGLQKLILEGSNLRFLPADLPQNLLLLDVTNSGLTVPPKNLPPRLQTLLARGNRLKDLPNPLPKDLETLDIRGNDFRVLSGVLPTNLKKLYASSNPLSDWPKDLPAGLETLDIGGNNLGNVTNKLPESLTTFSVHDARNFTALPNPLPQRLKVLGVENTGLRALPDNLPPELQVLLASGSKLNASPGNLPPCLEILDVRDTDIDPAALLQLMQNNTSIISLATPTDDPVLQKKLDEKLQENRERLERAKHVDMRTRPASITAVPANRASMPDPVDGSLPASSIPANLQDHDALAPDGSKDL
jgi:hypothetical protein